MSTLIEIQEAVAKLPADEKEALSLWLDSQRAHELSIEEENCLLRSLDQAVRDVDAGKGVLIGDARKRVSSWAAR